MIQMMKRDFQLSLFCCCLGKLTMASWLLTNTMFLLASHVLCDIGLCETDSLGKLLGHLARNLSLHGHSLCTSLRPLPDSFFPDSQRAHVHCHSDDKGNIYTMIKTIEQWLTGKRLLIILTMQRLSGSRSPPS